ncbi:MAG: ABC transporter ATP-binding protein [Lachnospiraceae bacterium]|nr:ABC transporter ATP-binding protein [Lachnospiraceae bacterium]
MISADKITKKIKNGTEYLTILNDITLEIHKSEFVSICGKSGSGKSTLLSILAGIDKPTAGTVLIDGVDIYSLTEKELAEFRNQNIGIVFQKFNLISSLTAIENVQVPQYLAKRGKKSNQSAKNILKYLGLEDKCGIKIGKLSGGEQQRVAIARALIQNPKIIFADEPTGSLDCANSRLIIDLLKKIQREVNTTIVLVTHDMSIAQITDRVIDIDYLAKKSLDL